LDDNVGACLEDHGSQLDSLAISLRGHESALAKLWQGHIDRQTPATEPAGDLEYARRAMQLALDVLATAEPHQAPQMSTHVIRRAVELLTAALEETGEQGP
jgi:hypothetical protein